MKNYKSKQITKKLILKLEQKLDKLNITIAYSDITNKYSYKIKEVFQYIRRIWKWASLFKIFKI